MRAIKLFAPPVGAAQRLADPAGQRDQCHAGIQKLKILYGLVKTPCSAASFNIVLLWVGTTQILAGT
jgi:hypothetical protein